MDYLDILENLLNVDFLNQPVQLQTALYLTGLTSISLSDYINRKQFHQIDKVEEKHHPLWRLHSRSRNLNHDI